METKSVMSLTVLQQKNGTAKIQGVVLDMKAFEDETNSRGSSSAEDLYNNFRSLPFVDWVLGLCSPSDNQQVVFETLEFSEMCNLRVLRLNYVQISGSYKNFPKGLRWLCMHGFPLTFIPSDLQMENMVALDMSNSKLQQLWKNPKLLKSLKFLNLSGCCQLLNVGHFSAFPLLESLILAGCINLIEVSESIGNCDRLVVLDMSECHKLKKLPGSLGNLKNLRKLLLNGCSNLGGFPFEMKDMESLEVLEANNINIRSQVSSSAIVEAIPRSVKFFVSSLPRSLVRLSLKNNNLSNESFPVDFSSLSMLEELYLDRNPIDSLPDCVRSLGKLGKLGYLSLNYCYRLKTILCAPKTIEDLNATECCSLEKITFQLGMSAPPEFFYEKTYSLTEIQDKFKLQAIAEIDELILHNLGWIDIEYVNDYKLSAAGFHGLYSYIGKILPAQMLYQYGIFSTYIKGKEVPKWFTLRSNNSSFTLHSSANNRNIRGLNMCIVSTISSATEVGPSTIAIRNLTKKSSWRYQPRVYVIPEANVEVRVWLSHWMFGNNEFEDGDEVDIDFNVMFTYGFNGRHLRYGGDGPNYANVREYGISFVYDDGNTKEDPLAYYKSWNHIIARDLSAANYYSSDYFLLHDWPN